MASARPYRTKAGQRYAARWRDPHGGSQERRGFTRKREALDHAHEQERHARRGDYVSPADAGQSLSSWAQEWEPGQDWKDLTKQWWPSVFNRITAVLGDPPIGAIRKSDMLRLRTELMNNYAHSTAGITLSTAKKLLRGCVRGPSHLDRLWARRAHAPSSRCERHRPRRRPVDGRGARHLAGCTAPVPGGDRSRHGRASSR